MCPFVITFFSFDMYADYWISDAAPRPSFRDPRANGGGDRDMMALSCGLTVGVMACYVKRLGVKKFVAPAPIREYSV